jgi:hypothetical protein
MISVLDLNKVKTKFNYISKKLIQSNINTYKKLNIGDKKELNTIVQNIIKNLKKYKYFDNNFISLNKGNKLKYILIKTNKVNIDNIYGIDTSDEIKKKMNQESLYHLTFDFGKGDKNIPITIYSNNKDNNIINTININKIMTRLYNLFTLYKYKNTSNYDLSMYNYIFYIYNNPRRANKEILSKNLSSKEYLQKLNQSSLKCFNTSSGITSFNKRCIIVSRTEDILGLLTHEILHGCGFINIEKSILIHNISLNFTEMIVNMFAAIVNTYLLCIELNKPKLLSCFLLIELIHSINHSIKYSILQKQSILTILNPNSKITLYQNANIYEYIVGKMIFFIFFNKIIKNKEFSNIFFSLDKSWDLFNFAYLDKYVIEQYYIFLSNKKILLLISNIEKIHLLNLSRYKDNNEICGNMLMQYYSLDPININIDTIKKYKYYNMYGGRY